MIRVGRYELGMHRVSLWLDMRNGGGSFDLTKNGSPDGVDIVVGGSRGWRNAVGILIHESMELCLSDVLARYVPDIDYSSGSDGYRFICDHNQYSEAVARTGDFVALCINDLSKALRKACHAGKNQRRKNPRKRARSKAGKGR